MRKREEKVISVTTERRVYEVISPTLDPRRENQWILDDDGRKIPAIIQDLDFLDAVRDEGIIFASGCTIDCEMQETWWETAEGIRMEFRVTQVHETLNRDPDELARERRRNEPQLDDDEWGWG